MIGDDLVSASVSLYGAVCSFDHLLSPYYTSQKSTWQL